MGGKYHADDNSVFRVKQVLTQLGVSVSHPLAGEIKASNVNHAFAFDPATQSFSDVERHYYECIRMCDFHIVCNQFKENIGYLGDSASLEVAYAMCYGRPIVVLHPVPITATVDSRVRSFLLSRLHHLTTYDCLRATPAQSRRFLTSLQTKCVDYGVTEEEQNAIENQVRTLLDGLSTETVDAAAHV
ncbi:MAG: hypothetical protein ACRDSP_05110 [Pseudonocardiaceae bacterium]